MTAYINSGLAFRHFGIVLCAFLAQGGTRGHLVVLRALYASSAVLKTFSREKEDLGGSRKLIEAMEIDEIGEAV